MTDLQAKRKFWIQSADFQSKNFESVNLDSAKVVLLSHNWDLERLNCKGMDHKEENYCNPNIGFDADNFEHVLQICPFDEDEAICFYTRVDQGEIDRPIEWIVDKASVQIQIRLLELFFDEEYEALVELCDGKVEMQCSDKAYPIYENIEKEESFNFSQDMEREQLEAIVNALIAPFYYEPDLFGVNEACAELNEKRFRFWINWLAGINDKLSNYKLVGNVRFPKPKTDSLMDAYFRLSEEELEICKTIIQDYSEKDENPSQEYIDECLTEVSDEELLGSLNNHCIYEQHIYELLSCSGAHLSNVSCDLCFVDMNEWLELSVEIRGKILQVIYDKKRKHAERNGPIKEFSLEDCEFPPVFQKQGELFAETCEKLSKYLGDENAIIALGGRQIDDLIDDGRKKRQITSGIQLFRNELILIINGETSDAIKHLTKRTRGDRKDSFILRNLKNEIGYVYRALRFSTANADQAVDTINRVLKSNGLRRYLSKDAIVKKAPSDLSDLHPGDLIHREIPVIEGQELMNYEGESFDDCLYRHADKWLKPYIDDYKEMFWK